ncbi:MAG: transglutaminase-like cysteine peptidase [Desulfovibrio sp.]|nr:transglutaminase-like cysteine peptidase [Desulfovibrio sp.]
MPGFMLVPVQAHSTDAANIREKFDNALTGCSPENFFGQDAAFPPHRQQQWRNLLNMAKNQPVDGVLRLVNGFFNTWPSSEDKDNYGEADYWAKPEEFVKHKGGDCEDYVIIKYLALRSLSYPAKGMWMFMVFDRARAGYHAVLAVNAGGRLFFLDNLTKPAYLLMPENVFLKNFIPLYAVNESGLWAYSSPEADKERTQALARKKNQSGSLGGGPQLLPEVP